VFLASTVVQDAATGVTAYRASSPDEEALVKAAKALGFNFTTPSPNVSVTITLKNGKPPESVVYQILNTNEFNSSR
jgi:magnesium-transporting ATPase (P-type)